VTRGNLPERWSLRLRLVSWPCSNGTPPVGESVWGAMAYGRSRARRNGIETPYKWRTGIGPWSCGRSLLRCQHGRRNVWRSVPSVTFVNADWLACGNRCRVRERSRRIRSSMTDQAWNCWN